MSFERAARRQGSHGRGRGGREWVEGRPRQCGTVGDGDGLDDHRGLGDVHSAALVEGRPRQCG